MDFPFTQTKLSENKMIRTFSEDVEGSELVWHMDREDRVVKVLESNSWYLQMDNQLPVLLEVGKSYEIPKMTYHRVIKGNSKLVLEITEGIVAKLGSKKSKQSDKKCPPATQDLALNTKNRDMTIKKYNYGPLNVDEPGDYWKKIADYWKTTEKAAKKSLCGNCVAFDISPRMKDCLPGDTFDEDGELGYCWMHHFKCHSARACHTWAKGGPIARDKESDIWQEKNKQAIEERKKRKRRKKTVKNKHHSAYGRSSKYFGSSFYDFGLLHGDEGGGSSGDAGGDGGGGDGNRRKKKSWDKEERKKRAKNCSNPKGFTMKQFCKNQKTRSKEGEKKNEAKDPKVGTGKKPKGSGRRLYTDENPKDTVSVEFSSVSAIQKTLAKSSFKSKSHKRQSQIINLIHQRVRAAYKNAKDPKVKARLKKAFEYAEKRKEASKKKTIRLRKEKKK